MNTTAHQFRNLFTSRRLLKLSLAFVFGLLLFATTLTPSAQAAVGISKTVSFQGKVVCSTANSPCTGVGTNVSDGVYDFVFKVYDAATSTANVLYTEDWTGSGLWSSTMSSAPSSGGESMTYSSDTNESTIAVGQILTNTTKAESVYVVAVNTGTNVITISPTRQAWATGDTVTNKIYVKDGVFRVNLGSLTAITTQIDWNSDTIFVGVRFNTAASTAESEMKPRIKYSAVPYAFNADQVNGLTVTSSSNDLTITHKAASATNKSITLQPITPSGTSGGGALNLTGGTALTTGGGGDVVVTGGTAAGSNQNGGGLTLNSGAVTGAGTSTLSLGTTNTTALNIGSSALTSAMALTSGASANNAFSITANSLVAGKGIAVSSNASAMSGNLINLTQSGNNVNNTGSLLSLTSSGASNAGALISLAQSGTGNDITGTGGLWSVTKAGVLTVQSCGGCGGGGGTWNGITAPTGDQTLTFDDDEQNIWTMNSDTEAFWTITPNSLTTGEVLVIPHSGSVIADGGSLVRLSSSSVDTGGATNGTILDIGNTGSTAATVVKITDTSTLTGNVFNISHSSSVLANGASLARIASTSVDTGTTTGNLLDLSSTASTAGTQVLQTYSGLQTGIGESIVTNALTSGKALSVTSSATGVTGSTTTGSLLHVSETGAMTSSFVGNLAYIDWTPGSAPATYPTGDLLRLHIGPNASAFTGNLFNIVDDTSNIFSVSKTSFTTSQPTNFTAAGDMGLAYDLMMTNPVASYIKSLAPLYIQAGETFNSSNLILKTYGQGTLVIDSGATTGTSVDLSNTTLTTGTGINAHFDGLTTGNGISLTSISTAGTTSASDTLLNIARSGANANATHTAYGLQSSVINTGTTSVNIAGLFTATGATTNTGVKVAAMTGATSTGLDIGAMSGATLNTGINLTSFATATTSKGLVMGTNSSATATGIEIGALSGGTANTGISIGGTSGGGTGTGLSIGAFTNTGSTQYGINISTFAGTHNGGTTAGVTIGNISSAGTTTKNYGIQLGTLTGGTTSNYQMQTGDITAIASAINAGLVIGTTNAVTGTAASSTNYGININPLNSTGTANYGMYIGNVSGATNNYGLVVGQTPAATATSSVLQLGPTAISGGSASGTYLSANAATAYAGDFQLFQQNNVLLYEITSVNTAVNGLKLTLAATAGVPTLAAIGSDANVGLTINTKATGAMILDTGSTGTINIGNNANAKTINIGNGGAAYTLNIGNSATAGTVFIGNGSNSTKVVFADFNGTTGPAGALANNGQMVIGSVANTTAQGGRIWIRSNGVNFRFNSTNNNSTSDYSEYLAQKEPSEPGDVMVIDPNASNTVRISRGRDEKSILGVITTHGTSYNQPYCEDEASCDRGKDPNFANVGMLGQVETKVSTENGQIQIGDRLTTSSKPGVAMKTTEAGQIIGRALESYSSSDTNKIGKVNVLISPSYFDPQTQVAQNSGNDQNVVDPDDIAKLEAQAKDVQPFETKIPVVKTNQALQSSDFGKYSIQGIISGAIQNLGKFSNAIIANLKAGSIESHEITSDTISANQAAFAKVDINQAALDHLTVSQDATFNGTLAAKGLTPLPGQNLNILLLDNQQLIITNGLGENVITFDNQGNAAFKGLITASHIKADQIDGLDLMVQDLVTKQAPLIIQAQTTAANLNQSVATGSANLSTLSDQIDQLLVSFQSDDSTTSAVLGEESTPSALFASTSFDLDNLKTDSLATGTAQFDSLHVQNSALVEAVLNVGDMLTSARLLVTEAAQFMGDVIFKKDVQFVGRPTFNQDTAGAIIIKKGQDQMAVNFTKEYDQVPQINININLDDLVNPKSSSDLQKKQSDTQTAIENAILSGDIKYIVSRKSKKSFIIKLNKPALTDLQFSWTALTSKDFKDQSITKLQPETIHAQEPTPKPSTAPPKQVKTLTINKNELGFLRVRSEPNAKSDEVGQVQPGEGYSIIDENKLKPDATQNATWYQIEYQTGQTGWISGSYVSVDSS